MRISIRGTSFQIAISVLALALFLLFFFILTSIDLQRLKGMLLEYRTQRAFSMVTGMEKDVENKIRLLVQMSVDGGIRASNSDFEAVSSLKDEFLRGLLGKAQEVERWEPADKLSPEWLLAFAQSGHIAVAAVVGEKGEPLIQTGPIPDVLMPRVYPVADGREGTAVYLYGENELETPGFVGFHRHEEKGAVILLLDSSGLQYWRMRSAVRRSAETLLWLKGVIYFALDDTSGNPVVRAGAPIPEVTDGRTEKYGGKIDGLQIKVIDDNSLEISLPFHLGGNVIGTARFGMESPANQLVVRERQHIFMWMGVMFIIGLSATAFYFHAQSRHNSKLRATREKLEKAERLSSLGRLAAGVAHEIRNPLNAISMAAQRIPKEFSLPGSSQREQFERITFIIRDEINRLNAIVEDFLSLSPASRTLFQAHPLTEVLERIVFMVEEKAAEKGIRIEKNWTDCPSDILMDPPKLQRALLNIVRNALESISGGGVVSISLESSGKDSVCIKVRDSGSGIQPRDLDRIFDPFYTTKANGTGVGLCIANEIVVVHGGEIRVHSEPDYGTTVEVILPIGADVKP